MKKKKKSYKPQIIYIIGTDGFSVAKSPFYYGNSQLTFYPLRARATAKPSSRDISQWQSSFLVGTFFLAEEELTGFHRIAASFCFTFFFFLDDSFKNTIIMVSSGWYSVRRPRAGARVVPRGECREGGGALTAGRAQCLCGQGSTPEFLLSVFSLFVCGYGVFMTFQFTIKQNIMQERWFAPPQCIGITFYFCNREPKT